MISFELEKFHKKLPFELRASTGGWHHFLYTQKDTIGTIYVDGMVAQSGTVKQRPISTLVKDQRLGTLYNWIGRSCYTGDVYLRQALVADVGNL